MKLKDYLIRIAKHTYRFVTKKKFYPPECNLDRQISNNIIYDALVSEKPIMISRFGTTELNCINNYLCVTNFNRPYYKRIIDYIIDNTHTPWWNESHFETMSLFSGIFPPSIETSEKFSRIYIHDIPLIDILGSFQYHEKFVPIRNDVIRLQLETLYPFFVDNPWTRALKNRKVLVIHPFDDTIRTQYSKRHSLFDDKDILPDFELITLKAVQSIANTTVPYKSWFEALDFMKNQIDSIDFDICIIGCGAYGLPLAAHVKRLGKKAIHLGGGTQLLFGIKGKRWEINYKGKWEYLPNQFVDINYSDLFNEFWVYPNVNDKPQNAVKVEGACYW